MGNETLRVTRGSYRRYLGTIQHHNQLINFLIIVRKLYYCRHGRAAVTAAAAASRAGSSTENHNNYVVKGIINIDNCNNRSDLGRRRTFHKHHNHHHPIINPLFITTNHHTTATAAPIIHLLDRSNQQSHTSRCCATEKFGNYTEQGIGLYRRTF